MTVPRSLAKLRKGGERLSVAVLRWPFVGLTELLEGAKRLMWVTVEWPAKPVLKLVRGAERLTLGAAQRLLDVYLVQDVGEVDGTETGHKGL